MQAAKQKLVRIVSYLSPELNSDLEKYATLWGVSKSALVTMALGQYIGTLNMSLDMAKNLFKEQLSSSSMSFQDSTPELSMEQIQKFLDNKK
jgi:hypothetical protein